MRAADLKGNLDGMLLAVLTAEPGHGYAIIEALRCRSGGRVNLPSGTIYPALHRLEDAGLVRSRWELVAGRKRRVYQITPAGERALSATKANWRDVIDTMRSVMLVDEPVR
ncbi:MAG TPA: helix-turn-helix transcriptional regulator [Pseudonocardiaceae bacterium]|jgi:DNA-binding PadR family transcriptional regulator|nr:helix-turn-helix transcriptional regulator [Pseudonocardiaceae bacterium]